MKTADEIRHLEQRLEYLKDRAAKLRRCELTDWIHAAREEHRVVRLKLESLQSKLNRRKIAKRLAKQPALHKALHDLKARNQARPSPDIEWHQVNDLAGPDDI